MSVARKARAVRSGNAAARSAAHVSKRPARQGREQTKKRDMTIRTERRCARSMTSRSAPSEIAKVAGKMKVEVVRPADRYPILKIGDGRAPDQVAPITGDYTNDN
jgi:hypothetical protein